jgi:hypothetical protein
MRGVYQITVKRPDKEELVYVGQAKNVRSRFNAHRRGLVAGRHANKHLQNAYDKYGARAFSFTLLELLDAVEDMTLYEAEWFDTLVTRYGRQNVANHYRPGALPVGKVKEAA